MSCDSDIDYSRYPINNVEVLCDSDIGHSRLGFGHPLYPIHLYIFYLLIKIKKELDDMRFQPLL